MPYKDFNKRLEYYRTYNRKNKTKRRRYFREYYRKDLKRREYQQKWEHRRRYGLSREDYTKLLTLQNNRCAGCAREFTDTPHIDHDHLTGKIRGLLCKSCNLALGFVGDNKITLKQLIEYLEKG
jgi:hypothetical protein